MAKNMCRMDYEERSKKSYQVDMTTGSLIKNVLWFVLPICLGNILQQLYGIVDTLVIGKFCGANSLAAVGTSTKPVEILLCVFLGIGTGISILVSQYTGSGDEKRMKELVQTSITFLYVSAIPLTVLGPFLGIVILKFMKVPEDVYEAAASYINLVLLGTIGNMGYNMNAGILRGFGDSMSSLLFLFVACGINILLDLILVGKLEMDVEGAAIATSVSMLTAWFFSILYIRKKYRKLEFPFFPHSINKEMLKRMLAVGLPLGLNSSIYSLGHILLQSLINAQGTVFIAGCTIGEKIDNIGNMANAAFASAGTTYAGQNLGAGKGENLKSGMIRIPVMASVFCLGMAIIILVFSNKITMLFTQDVQIQKAAMLYILWTMPFMWIFALFNTMMGIVNGLGIVKYPTIVNLISLWGIRIPICYLLGNLFGKKYLLGGIAASYLFAFLCMLVFVFIHLKMERKRN